MAPGYVDEHPASALPSDTVVTIVGTNSQYLYDGTQLDPIDDATTLSCLLGNGGQSTPDVVPTEWSDSLATGSAATCVVLGDGLPEVPIAMALPISAGVLFGGWVLFVRIRNRRRFPSAY
jgi:hypothetical protein